MLRADNVLCGTSSTGTGTLTLAACPAPPGGLDFDKWLKATGLNFVSGNALITTYTIVEYTDATFATAKQQEKGIGTLTLGASITAATLARSKVQSTVTGLNGTPSPTYSSPTAITIGTAANTLVFIGASAADVLAFQPFQDTALTSNGFPPLMCGNPTFNGGAPLVNNQDWTWPFTWAYGMLAKRVYFRVESGYTGGVSNLYARLYQINSSGQAGKLLYDFGVVGTAGSSLNVSAFTMIASGASGNGFLLTPGEYFLSIFTTFSGGSGTPSLTQWAIGSGPLTSGFRGASGVGANFVVYDNSGSSTAPDPAPAEGGQVSACPCFFLAAS
jgi:hypothetical protein